MQTPPQHRPASGPSARMRPSHAAPARRAPATRPPQAGICTPDKLRCEPAGCDSTRSSQQASALCLVVIPTHDTMEDLSQSQSSCRERSCEPYMYITGRALLVLFFQLVDLIQGRQVPRLRVDALHHDEAPVQGLPAQPCCNLRCSLTWGLAPQVYRTDSDHSCMTDQDTRRAEAVR